MKKLVAFYDGGDYEFYDTHGDIVQIPKLVDKFNRSYWDHNEGE